MSGFGFYCYPYHKPLAQLLYGLFANRNQTLLASFAIEQAIDKSKPQGVRDNAIIEMLYSCGLRISELLGLRLENINTEEGWVLALGKGGKQRLVPIHPACAVRVKRFMDLRAAYFAGKETDSEVFLNNRGKKLSRISAWKDLADLGRKANISRPLHPHLFRHTFASHMLQGGADLRSLQEMLGHANLTTTQIYTHLDVTDLKNKHKKFHPRG